MSMSPWPPGDSARYRIEQLRRLNPAAVTLAVLASTAVRIEPALLRRLRLLVPDADVGAEADLWSSGLLESASPLAVSFDPECAHLLQREFSSPALEDLRPHAVAAIEAEHASEHWSLRLEERINRLMAGPTPDLDGAEQLLYAAIGRLRVGADAGEAGALHVARWLLTALGRVPPRLRDSTAGQVATVGAGVRLDGRYAGPPTGAAGVDIWMPWLLELAGVRQRHVMIHLNPGELVINGTAEGGAEIRVPGTSPMVLNLTWHDGRVHHRRVEFSAGEVCRIPIQAEQVVLRDLTGAGYTVARPDRGAAILRHPDGLDFSAHRAALRPCLGRATEVERVAEAIQRDGKNLVTISGPAGAGKTVLLGAALDELQNQGYAVAEHFYGVEPRWDAPATVSTSLMTQIRGAVTSPPPLPTWEGKRRALIITNSSYDDRRLDGLRPVGTDAEFLGETLADQNLCGFELTVLTDPDLAGITSALDELLLDAEAEDLLLMYLATHTIVDQKHMTFVARNTDLDRLPSTGLSAGLLARRLSGTPARTILLLDCCQVGGRQSERIPVAPLPEHVTPLSAGSVISAPLTIEYRVTGARVDRVASAPEAVPFTRVLADGLRSGLADLNGDGAITVDELGRFVSQRNRSSRGAVVSGPLRQWSSRMPVIARKPVVRRPLPIKVAADGRVPASFLEEAIEDARHRKGAGLRGIVIALDGLPGPIERFVREASPLRGPLPYGVHVLATLSDDDEDQLGRSLLADARSIPLAPRSSDVCRAMAEYHRTDLTRAFGDVGAGTALVRASEDVPGRLAATIRWAVSRPPGSARVTDLPPFREIATDGFWSAVPPGLLAVLLLIAVARPGCTVRALAAAAEQSTDGLEARLTDLAARGLVLWDRGSLDAEVTIGAGEVADAVTRRFPDRVPVAHRRHAAVFPFGRPASALPYQIDSVAHHAVHSGDVGVIARTIHCGGYLELRARRAGIPAVLDDLARLAEAADNQARWAAGRIRHALSGLAEILGRMPDHFTDLLWSRLVADGAAATATDLFGDRAEPAIVVRRLDDVGGVGFRALYSRPVRAAVGRPGRMTVISTDTAYWHPAGATAPTGLPPATRIVRVAEVGERLAIATPSALVLVSPVHGTAPRTIDLAPATVTTVLGGDSIHLGLADGRVLEFRSSAPRSGPVRRLVGHHGAITAIVRTGPTVISGGEDGTARVWPPGTQNAPTYVYRGHRAPITALVSARPGWVLSGDEDGRLCLWSIDRATERAVASAHSAPITALAELPDLGFASADESGLVTVWGWDGGQTISRLVDHRAPGGEAVKIMVYAEGVLAIATASGTVHWVDAGAGAALLRTVEAGGEVHAMAFDADGSLLVAHIGGVASYEPVLSGAAPADVGYRSALAVDQRGDTVLAGMARGVATLASGAVVAVDAGGDPAVSAAVSVDGTAVTVRASGLAYAGGKVQPGGGYLLAAAGRRTCWLLGADGRIRQASPRPGTRVRPVDDPDATALAVDDEAGLLVTGHADGRVRVTRFNGPVVSDTATSGGRVLDVVAADGVIVGLSADGTMFRLDGSAPSGVTRLTRHDGAIRLALTGSRLISCSVDGTVRLTELDTGHLLGIVAGRLPFHAVAAGRNGELVARDAADRLWLLRVSGNQGRERTQR